MVPAMRQRSIAMEVDVRIHINKDLKERGWIKVTMPDNSTLGNLITELKYSYPDVQFEKERITLVHNKRVPKTDSTLRNNDTIEVVYAAFGG